MEGKKSKVTLIAVGVIFTIIGFLGGMEYKAFQIRNALAPLVNMSDSISTTNTNEDKSYIEAIEEEKGQIIEKNVGDLVEFATQNIKVTNVEESNMTNPDFGSPTIAPENSKFVFVTLETTNTTKNDLMWVTDFNLVDQDERSFSGYDQAIGSVKNYLDYRKLSSGIKETGIITYLVPNDSESYSILIPKGGTKEYYKINLK
jgi:hypothetical protein